MPSLLLSSRISSGHTSGNWNCSRSISAQLAQNSSALSSLGIRIARRPIFRPTSSRSEEHTSELQSQSNLVCRLLLEKKKQHIGSHSAITPLPVDIQPVVRKRLPSRTTQDSVHPPSGTLLTIDSLPLIAMPHPASYPS